MPLHSRTGLTLYIYKVSDVSGCVMLNGQQYLERPYNMTEFFARPNDNIVLHFKTINPGGLFFYLKAGPAAYILLKLDHGKIVFEADFGAGIFCCYWYYVFYTVCSGALQA